MAQTVQTGATYPGEPGHHYTFRVTARDNVSNAASAEAAAFTSQVTKYYYLNGQRVAMRGPDEAVSWLHGDHLGSTTLATDGAQEVVARQLYELFGQMCKVTGTLEDDALV